MAGMCPVAMEALIRASEGPCASYGEDAWSREAADAFRQLFKPDCDVYFVATGTAATTKHN